MLLLAHPEVAALDCNECTRWVFDFREKRFSTSRGKRVPRPKGGKLPCWQCPKCDGPEGASPATGTRNTLSTKNLMVLQAYYQRIRGDRLTRHLFGIIRRTIDTHDRHIQRTILELLATR